MYQILKLIWFFIGICFIILFILLSEKKQLDNTIKSTNIISKNKIESSDYLDKLIKTNLSELNIKIIDKKTNEISYKKLESILNTSSLIKKVSIYRTLKGNLFIELISRRPIARILIRQKKSNLENKKDINPEIIIDKDKNSEILNKNLDLKQKEINNNQESKKIETLYFKKSYYIDDTGFLIPTSLKYQFKVLIITYDKFKGLSSSGKISEYDSKLLKLLLYIDNDKFLKAQITHIDINNDGSIKLFTQISKQSIEFGQPEKLDCKFKKFKIVYKKILPKSGWNKYNRINLEFDKQIICE